VFPSPGGPHAVALLRYDDASGNQALNDGIKPRASRRFAWLAGGRLEVALRQPGGRLLEPASRDDFIGTAGRRFELVVRNRGMDRIQLVVSPEP
jgi:hypothetical protein